MTWDFGRGIFALTLMLAGLTAATFITTII
jgi:hypothetical protein